MGSHWVAAANLFDVPLFPQAWHCTSRKRHFAGSCCAPHLKHGFPSGEGGFLPADWLDVALSLTLWTGSTGWGPACRSSLASRSASSIAWAIFMAFSKVRSTSAKRRCWVLTWAIPHTRRSRSISSRDWP